MNCPKCSNPVIPGSLFCSVCGAKLDETSEPAPEKTEQISIGRSPDNDICLDDDLVSRHHATLFLQKDGTWRLEDLSSSNGTFVNGNQVAAAALSPDDRIRIGGFSASLAELLAMRTPRQEAAQAGAPEELVRSGPEPPPRGTVPPTAVKCIVLYGLFHCVYLAGIVFVLGANILYAVAAVFMLFIYYNLYRLKNWARIVFVFICFLFIGYNIADTIDSKFQNFIGLLELAKIDAYFAAMVTVGFATTIFQILSVYFLMKKSVAVYFKKTQEQR